MISPRWKKMLGDFRVEKKRMILMISAISVSLIAVIAVSGAFSILTQEIKINYLGTNPASATIDIEEGIDEVILNELKNSGDVETVEAREVMMIRVLVDKDWLPMLLFAAEDYSTVTINRIFGEKSPGVNPEKIPENSMLVERTARDFLKISPGDYIKVRTPQGGTRQIRVSGSVHDPGLAPAVQERMGYGYVDKKTLDFLGEKPLLHELRILVKGNKNDPVYIKKVSTGLAKKLENRGYHVHEIRIPPPMRHPHQTQMETVLLMLLIFSGLSLILSSVLTANLVSSMLSRQVREIGILKTIGASTSQISGLYFTLILLLGGLSYILALPVGVASGYFFSKSVALMLNFNLTGAEIPSWVFIFSAGAAVMMPFLFSFFPVRKAGKITVKQAMDSWGISTETFKFRFFRMPHAIRNLLRKPKRLILTLGLLAAGGAMFIAALSLLKSWEKNLDKFYETRFYDVEFKFHTRQHKNITGQLRAIKGVSLVEEWGFSPAALVHGDEQFVFSRTYPDMGHASFSILAPPADTKLIHFPLKEGRWLEDADYGNAVLNHSAQRQFSIQTGDTIGLFYNDKKIKLHVIGIVEEIGYPAAVYVTKDYFDTLAENDGAQIVRISSTAKTMADRTAVIRSIERFLEKSGISVLQGIPLTEHRSAIGDHIRILINALISMAVIMAIVGTLGLGSSMSISVMERTREIGVMKTIGATPGAIIKMIQTEALLAGITSWLLAVIVSIPLTFFLEKLIGIMGFLAPLPFTVSAKGMVLWLLLSGLTSLVSTWYVAKKASRLTISESLVYV